MMTNNSKCGVVMQWATEQQISIQRAHEKEELNWQILNPNQNGLNHTHVKT